MSKRRKPLTEEAVFEVIKKHGRFWINPLRFGDRNRVKVLERMRKDGKLKRRRFKLDYVEYRLPGATYEDD